MAKTPLVILGGRSIVAPYLIQRLAQEGLDASVVSRRPVNLPEGFHTLSIDLTQSSPWRAPIGSIVISLVPIWVLARSLSRFSDVQAILAVSSTSRYGKAASDDPKERFTAENLELSEYILQSWCLRNNVVCTILRPTLIYDGIQDENVTRIVSFIKRYGAFPVAFPGKGLRQPIHADDVAKAIMGALGNAAAYHKALNIAGGQVLTYRDMIETVFKTLKRKPRPILLPASLLEFVFKAANKLGFVHEKTFGFSVFKRMNEDLVFDCAEGLELLRYAPRGFEPEMKAS